MPRIDQATEETALDIIEETEKALGGIEQAFRYLRKIGSLFSNDKGRGFGVIVRTCRRIAVKRAFTGSNQKEIAERLGVTEETIRHDIRSYYNTQERRVRG